MYAQTPSDDKRLVVKKLLPNMSRMNFRLLFDAFLGFIRLGFSTRFRVRGAYWRWRHETAFGNDAARHPGRIETIRLAIDYAAWTTRMRRLR